MICRGFLVLMCVLTVSATGLGADDDLVAEKLKAARKEFERAHKQARTGLLEDLKKKAAAFQKAGNLQSVLQIQAEIEAFEENGTLPNSVSTRVFESLVKRAGIKLDAAYAPAIRQLTMDGMIEAAQALQKELEELKSNYGNPEKPAVITLHNAVGTGKMHFGELVFSNRDYRWKVFPPEVDGWKFTLHQIREPKEYEFTVEKEGMVYVCFGNFENLQKEQPFLQAGWEKVELDQETSFIFLKAKLKKGKYRLPIGHPHSGTMVIYRESP